MKLGAALDIIIERVIDYLDNNEAEREILEQMLGDQRRPQLEFIRALEELGYDETAARIEETLGL